MKEQGDTRRLLCCSLLVLYQYTAVDLRSERENKSQIKMVDRQRTQLEQNSKKQYGQALAEKRGVLLASPGNCRQGTSIKAFALTPSVMGLKCRLLTFFISSNVSINGGAILNG